MRHHFATEALRKRNANEKLLERPERANCVEFATVFWDESECNLHKRIVPVLVFDN